MSHQLNFICLDIRMKGVEREIVSHELAASLSDIEGEITPVTVVTRHLQLG